MSIEVDPDWWKTLFDGYYLLTDARSIDDEELTCREIDFFCELIPLRTEEKILDFCGGHGRHTLELYERGYKNCTVLDYSEHLLNHGRACAADRECVVDFVQGDARHTDFEANFFDHVLLLGNSLGYQVEEKADFKIIAEACRVLRPGGRLMLDVSDGAGIKSSFNSTSKHDIDIDMTVCREREISGNSMLVREKLISKSKGPIRDKCYSIRLFDAESLLVLVRNAGFADIKIHTGFSPHKEKGDYGFMNNRLLVTACKP